ncbi:MAG: tripartite tricarboxylate transporter substrate binding protein [Burkholderiaceae bacterium]
MTTRRGFAAAAAIGLTAAAGPRRVLGAGYPERPVRMVVGFPPGQSLDIVARIVAERLGAVLGQPVVVENRAGAAGIIAHEAVRNAPPDGYTLLISSSGSLAINPSLYRKLPYDPVRDFAPIVAINASPMYLATRTAMPVSSVVEMIPYVKARPGKLTYGSGGSGLTGHIAMEMLKDAAGLDLLHVPYKGSAPMITDLISGQVDFCIEPSSSILPQARAGKVRLLGVTTSKRQEAMPELPTIAEQGVADFEAMTWSGLLAPAGTQVAIVEQLNRAMNQVLEHPEVVARIRGNGSATVGGSRADFERFVRAEIARWGRAVRASGAQVD